MNSSAASLLAMSAAMLALPAEAGQPQASVRYTAYGVAHVSAPDFAGAGLGYGWAFARDNLCQNVEQAVRLAGTRSLYFDPEATYLDLFAGGEISNADSDAAYRYLLNEDQVARLRRTVTADMRGLVSDLSQASIDTSMNRLCLARTAARHRGFANLPRTMSIA